MAKRCPRGSRRNKKTKQCVRKSAMPAPRKKCPKGSRKDKKTGKCRRKLSKSQKSDLCYMLEYKLKPSDYKPSTRTFVRNRQTLRVKRSNSSNRKRSVKRKKSASSNRK